MTAMTSADGLAIEADGRPTKPMLRLNIDDLHDADAATVARMVASIEATVPLTIGTATRTAPPTLQPVLAALSMTLAGPEVRSDAVELIPVADPEVAFANLSAAIRRTPSAAVALGQLVRQTCGLATTPGLAAEAAVYSMLLGGNEFADWLSTADYRAPGEATARPLVALKRVGDMVSLRLDHSERRNALSFRMREQLFAALELAVIDEEISSVDLAGTNPIFCSGGDLAEFGTADDLVAAYLVRLDRAPWRLLDQLRERLGTGLRIHVQGAAIGAGAELAAFGGRVTCSPDTYFSLPEVAMGLVPGAGGTVSITRRIGRWRAAWLMLSGSRLDDATAQSWGLVDEIVARP